MIVVRAPLRVSFVGGGTDLPEFYHRRPGRVISSAIDKFVYVVVNRTPLIEKVSVRYATSETVDHPRDLKHTRIKAALLDLGIERGIEIASFATIPAKTGMGSSSSFSVALMKALHAFRGEKLDAREAAEAACRLEIELLSEPIGKQDQYAASFGGMNVLEFNPDGTVEVQPVMLDYKRRFALEDHLLLFFTGLTRDAGSVLQEQRANIEEKFETLSAMADAVPEFRERLEQEDFEGLGRMLHEAWQKKRTLASTVSTSVLDKLYEAGLGAGAWGGKVLGAGGGGCILFLVKAEKKMAVREAVRGVARANDLTEFREIPVRFVQCGAEILWNGDYASRSEANPNF